MTNQDITNQDIIAHSQNRVQATRDRLLPGIMSRIERALEGAACGEDDLERVLNLIARARATALVRGIVDSGQGDPQARVSREVSRELSRTGSSSAVSNEYHRRVAVELLELATELEYNRGVLAPVKKVL